MNDDYHEAGHMYRSQVESIAEKAVEETANQAKDNARRIGLLEEAVKVLQDASR